MRRAGDAGRISSRISQPHSSNDFNYENLAGALAAKVSGLLKSTDPRELFPPFQLVIMSHHGTVVFECEVSRHGKVRRPRETRQVRRSHFPVTVFLTDRSQITRTFQIERGASGG